jgi:hypothetical protein
VSGVELKAPVLSNALKQPFSTTGMLSSLMAKCEAKSRDLEITTGGLETLLTSCPQYQGLFLIKCVLHIASVLEAILFSLRIPSIDDHVRY